MKFLLPIAFLVLNFWTECSGQTIENSPVSFPMIDTKDSNKLYFPVNTFGDTFYQKPYVNFVNSWYSNQLLAMEEPILSKNTSQNEIYRFTCLRTFHNPFAIRIERKVDSFFIYWKMSDGTGGYSPGKLTVDKCKAIDKVAWDKFKDLLTEINFFEMPTIEYIGMGMDGSEWILEGKTSNQYHVVNRWTPNKKSKIYKCGKFLIGLMGAKIRHLY